MKRSRYDWVFSRRKVAVRYAFSAVFWCGGAFLFVVPFSSWYRLLGVVLCVVLSAPVYRFGYRRGLVVMQRIDAAGGVVVPDHVAAAGTAAQMFGASAAVFTVSSLTGLLGQIVWAGGCAFTAFMMGGLHASFGHLGRAAK